LVGPSAYESSEALSALCSWLSLPGCPMMVKMGKKRSLKPPGRETRSKKLRALSCYQEVYERICAGWPLAQVARFIQEERHEYTAISRHGLEQQLADFRKTMPPGDLVAKRFPEVFDQAKEAVVQGIDELKELEELYRIQMHRVSVDFATEKGIGKLMPSMTAEIREARNLLESMANLKMEMGVLSRAPKGVDVSVGVEVEATLSEDLMARFGDGAVGKVLQDPESRRKVMGVVERFLKLPASDDTN
jgi:hypothetical protein